MLGCHVSSPTIARANGWRFGIPMGNPTPGAGGVRDECYDCYSKGDPLTTRNRYRSAFFRFAFLISHFAPDGRAKHPSAGTCDGLPNGFHAANAPRNDVGGCCRPYIRRVPVPLAIIHPHATRVIARERGQKKRAMHNASPSLTVNLQSICFRQRGMFVGLVAFADHLGQRVNRIFDDPCRLFDRAVAVFGDEIFGGFL